MFATTVAGPRSCREVLRIATKACGAASRHLDRAFANPVPAGEPKVVVLGEAHGLTANLSALIATLEHVSNSSNGPITVHCPSVCR